MRGLLDFVATPEGQGLLSAVAGGLAGARRGTPFNNVGRGLLAGTIGYGNAQDRVAQQEQDAVQKQFRDMQMAQMRTQMEQQQGQQAWRQGLPDVLKQSQQATYGAGDEGPTMAPPDPAKLQQYMMDPRSPFADKLLEQRLFPKAADYKVVGNALVGIGPDGVKPVYTAPQEAKKTPLELALDAAGITDPLERSRYLRAGVQKSVTHAPAPSAIVNLKQETEEAKKVGGFFGEEYGNILKGGTAAQGKLNRYSRLGELLDGTQTGKFAATGLEVAKAARALGFNVGENVGNLEAAQALSGEIALELRNPSGGAGMPGAMSDADRQFLTNMVPGLQTTPQGRTLMLQTAKRMAQRDIDVAKMARDYRKKNGSLDEGFYDELARFSEANPLFNGLNAPSGQSGGSGGWSAKKVN